CLNWTAAGKTSAEIADILGLSEHTVNHYLNRATKKLDTVNRTQAVAKALRIGLIK
ncbi:response regulator transcription factor, partial [Paraburkholderia sp. SIMBA_027]